MTNNKQVKVVKRSVKKSNPVETPVVVTNVTEAVQVAPQVVAEEVAVVQDEDRSQKKKRNLVTAELESELTFLAALTEMKDEVERANKMNKELRNKLNKLEATYRHDLTRALKSRKQKKDNKPTGFVKKSVIPADLLKLVNEKPGVEMSMPEYTRKLYAEIKKRNLFYEDDRRVFRADDQFKKIFGLKDSVNESTNYKDKNGFNFSTLQYHISQVTKKAAETAAAAQATA
jgi:chromatin remodeling complex protein RSC6